MARQDVVNFLKAVTQDSSLQEKFRVKNKEELMGQAKDMAYAFTENELDDVVWEMEMLIAENRGEKFDALFSLWRTMWGKYYFSYVVEDVLGSLPEQDLEQVASKG